MTPATMLDTTNWVEVPFTVDGVKFNSVMNPIGGIYRSVKKIPIEMFIEMNVGAVHNLMDADVSTMTNSEIETRLVELNLGASEALIQLA